MSFQRTAGRTVIFSEALQAIYELNEVAAVIWCRLEGGASVAAIVADLTALGLPLDTAGDYTLSALSQWRRLGLVEFAGNDGEVHRQTIALAGALIELRFASSVAETLVRPHFRCLETDAGSPDLVLEIGAEGDRFTLCCRGHPPAEFTADELIPAVRARVTMDALERGTYQMALHAASLVHDGRMMLLLGAPGTGKTTLSLGLASAGLGFAGDDIALLEATGNATGVPLPAAVKSGSWPLLENRCPEVARGPVHRRPDGRRVRYVTPAGVVRGRPLPIGWVVDLRRRADGAASLAPLDLVDAMRLLLGEAFTPKHRLTTEGFGALVGGLGEAACHTLTYAGLDDAVACLRAVCR